MSVPHTGSRAMVAFASITPMAIILSFFVYVFLGVLVNQPLPLATKVTGWLVLVLCGSTAAAALIAALRARVRGNPAGVHLAISALACLALFSINGATLFGGF